MYFLFFPCKPVISSIHTYFHPAHPGQRQKREALDSDAVNASKRFVDFAKLIPPVKPNKVFSELCRNGVK